VRKTREEETKIAHPQQLQWRSYGWAIYYCSPVEGVQAEL
jgi:hypothetical protein